MKPSGIELNVLGYPLEACSCEPMTGWHRDGSCRSDASDVGQHTICCVINDQFLTYSKAQGNDLSTPMPEFGFAGLNSGDRWCVCAARWRQAYDDGVAPNVRLEATHIDALNVVGIDILKEHCHP